LPKPKAHPRYAEYKAWFKQRLHDSIAVQGEYFRMAGPRHTTASEIIDGVAAFKGGGRWNPPRGMKIVYLSRAPLTATAEAMEHHRYYHLPFSHSMPKVMVAVWVEVEKVIDLTNPVLQKDFRESMTNLLAEDWRAVTARGDQSATQAIGRAAFASGLQGLLVRSKPNPNGVNLAIYPTRLTARSRLEVLRPAELAMLGKPA
jgi:RES domain-containing protein